MLRSSSVVLLFVFLPSGRFQRNVIRNIEDRLIIFLAFSEHYYMDKLTAEMEKVISNQFFFQCYIV